MIERTLALAALLVLVPVRLSLDPPRGPESGAAKEGIGLDGLRNASQGSTYEEPSQEDLLNAERLFTLLLSVPQNRQAAEPLCGALQWDLLDLLEAGERFSILKEKDGRKRGWGLYAFRRERWDTMVLEAPHSSDDAGTGFLAGSMFLESRCVAVAWNTVSRKTAVVGGASTADLAHLPDSILHAFTRAFIKCFPGGTLIQLHGFDSSVRKTQAGSESCMILSSGDDSPAPWILNVAKCLGERVCPSVLVYPRDIRELGATTNTHGRLFRDAKHEGFIHVEMSAASRRELRKDKEARAGVLECLPCKQP